MSPTPPCQKIPSCSRRAFLGAAGATLGLLGTSAKAPAQSAPRRPPNVLLIMTDDQGYSDLSCLGSTYVQTPNLDRLYGDSARLTHFHVSPTCAPTRAALMTGRYNNRVGVWHTIMGRSLLRRGEATMADYFSGAGYRTGIFGKWHLGDNFSYRPQDRGFQEVLVHGGGGVGQAPDYWGNDYFDDTYFHNGTPEHFPGYCTDVWFDGAMRFIESDPAQPFFCYIPTNAPHGPYRAKPEDSQPFKDRGLNDEQSNFLGMIKNIDDNMGKLLARLDALSIADDTIVVFITDNGSAMLDSPLMRDRKGSEYEGGHHVPCFIRWPAGGLDARCTVPMVTAHIDLLPTLLDLCDAKAGPMAPFDGISLRPWLEEPETAVSERTLVVDSQRIEQPEKWRKSAVLDKNWRLVNGTELYDLDSDPLQQQDRAADFPERVARLRKAYETWWDDVSATFNQYCPIVIGTPGQPPEVLGSMDWHGEKPAWNQPYIMRGAVGNGFWAIDVAEAGEYHFDLRRWPVEASAPIRGALEGGTPLAITEARIAIADQKKSMPVGDSEHYARFTIPLSKGECQLKTNLICDDGQERGAYYVVVTRVS